MTGSERLGHGFLSMTLLVSVIGFLGYYNADGFVSLPPTIVYIFQMLCGILAALFLRDRLWTNTNAVLPLLLVAIWSAATLIWADDSGIAARRWFLVFTPGLLICTLAAGDPRPHQTLIRFAILIIVIVLASAVFSGAVVALWDRMVPDNALKYFLLYLNGWAVGVAEGGRQYEMGLYIPRYSGFTSNPNSMSLFAAIGVIILAAIARPRWNLQGLGIVAISLSVAFVLLLSGSRASFAMTAVGIFFVVLMKMNQRQLARLTVFLVCGLIFALYMTAWAIGTTPEISPVEAQILSERSENWRVTNLNHNEVFELRERSAAWR
ncbi:MAG TPA: hypothetical protein DIT35_05775, partial [Rhodospirillaceae bacterium]|nr:hypothetical protein [Rhodospirillaceae bacterium]